MGECHEIREVRSKKLTVSVNGRTRVIEVRKQVFVIQPKNCYGDCHKIYPIDGRTMICEPIILEN